MAGNVHPILSEYSSQIPKGLQTYQAIHGQKEYEEIAELSRQEMLAFKSLDGVLPDGRSVQDVLRESGSEESIENPESMDNDRIRVVGVLSLITEFSAAMAED